MESKQWELYFDAVKNKNWQKAVDSLNAILKAEPKNPQVHLKIGDVFQKKGDISRAVSAYQQSAWFLMKDGYTQKALAVFKVILRLDPNNAEAIRSAKELMMEIEGAKIKPAEEPSMPLPDIEVKAEGNINIQPEAEVEEPALHIPFLSSLPEDEIKQITERLKTQSFLPGQKVVEEGDFGDSVFVIISGKAKVVAHILGNEIELATLSVGDVFGEVAFLTGRPRTASVIADDELRVMEFNRLILEEIFEKYPEILKKLEDFYQSHLEDTLSKVRTRIKK
ncbi:MAG: cyclic nucleotide-binding domain-containing protein [Nitrospirae bacterium]|nr:cyclic nucleotide-binding domain-containing protein [Nitrospirota bacterium]MBI3378685.1 cyclic nucleotide-binding domain-containing protein [Nitrospirota bacterium]